MVKIPIDGKSPMGKRIMFRIASDKYALLKYQASRHGITVSSLSRHLLHRYLEDVDRYTPHK